MHIANHPATLVRANLPGLCADAADETKEIAATPPDPEEPITEDDLPF